MREVLPRPDRLDGEEEKGQKTELPGQVLGRRVAELGEEAGQEEDGQAGEERLEERRPGEAELAGEERAEKQEQETREREEIGRGCLREADIMQCGREGA